MNFLKESKWESFVYYIKRENFITSNIRTIFYNVTGGIYNIYKWFPTIWKDRQWDHYFLYQTIKTKIDFMLEFYSNPENLLTTEKHRLKIVKELKICSRLLHRLINDEYDCFDCPEYKEFLEYERQGGTQCFTEFSQERNKKIPPQQRKVEYRKYLSTMKKAKQLRKNDKEMLFKIFTKHIDTWWD